MHPQPQRARVSLVFVLLIVVTVCGGLLCTLGGRVPVTAGVVLLVLGGWAVSLCLHEFGHAAVAYRGGDTSVADKGYLTLDIRRYTDPTLSFVLPLILLLLGGIPLPGGAVWINNWAIRSRAARSLVSLAGPAVNLLLGTVLAVVVASAEMPFGLLNGLSYLALVQMLAFLLNILPVPGLDGFGVLEPYLPERARELAAKVRPWAPLVFFVLIISVQGASALFFAAGRAIFAGLGGDSGAAGRGYSAFMFWRS
ncbi:MAG: site-2 protease family protein [Pseudonocardia sp.]